MFCRRESFNRTPLFRSPIRLHAFKPSDHPLIPHAPPSLWKRFKSHQSQNTTRQPSLSMYDDYSHQHEGSPDPLYAIVPITLKVDRGLTHLSLLSDEFLAQLLADIPVVLFNPIATTPPLPSPPPPPPLSPPPPQSPSTSGSVSAAPHAPNRQLICQWVSPHHLPFICGVPLSQDPKLVCTHFRHAHNVRGNEKVIVCCHWRDCEIPPMQRGSLIRHVLAVHLGLLRWRCEACGRVFSRKGTVHVC